MSLYEELNRRNVIRVALAYLAGSWLLIQVAETVFPLFGMDAAPRLVVILLAIGFFPALALAWAFELTPEGLRRDSDTHRDAAAEPHAGRRLDRFIMIALALAVSYFALDKFVLDPARDAEREAAVATQARSEALVEQFGDKSIAVLPFVNLGADPEQEYFSDGIAEELLNLLARVPELRVISRSSSFAFKGREVEMPALAEQLNVGHVLEGSVRRAGDRVRVTVQLIEARSDTHLWSETYESRADDVFATQDRIAASVAEQLRLKLVAGGTPQARSTDPAAYALFLQARHIRLQNTPEAYAKALALYQQALDIDPEYPPAWEGLAEIYVFQAGRGLRPVNEGYRLARNAVNRALAIDPEFGVAVAGLGWIAVLYDHDLAAAARYFERALALDPTNLDIISGAAFLAEAIGHLDTAIALKEYAVARDPMGPIGHLELANAYLKAGRAEPAEASARVALDLRPGAMGAQRLLGLALLRQGKTGAAAQAIEQESFAVYRLAGLAVASFEMGQVEMSNAYLDRLIEDHAEEAPFQVASVFAWRGERDAAFDWLARARELNDTGLSAIVSYYGFDSLRDDPRWQAFLARIGKSDAELAEITFDVRPPE